MILKEIDETFSEEELDGIMSDVSFSIIDIILTIMFITIMVRTQNTILSKIINLLFRLIPRRLTSMNLWK